MNELKEYAPIGSYWEISNWGIFRVINPRGLHRFTKAEIYIDTDVEKKMR